MTVDFVTPDPSRVLGLSTSHWTGRVDWAKAKANGIQFAIIKACHGKNTNIAWFRENYQGARDAGVLVGAYAWLTKPTFMTSAGGQARAFAALLRNYPTDLPPVVDFEKNGKTNRYDPKVNPTASDLWGWVKPFEDTTGVKPMIYTSPGYWGEYGSISQTWADYPLWQAEYNPQTVKIKPWGKWDIWQFSEQGRGEDYGVPRDGEIACELNYWRGSLDELYAFCGKVPPAPPVPPEPMHVTVEIGADNLFVYPDAKSVTIVTKAGETVRLP